MRTSNGHPNVRPRAAAFPRLATRAVLAAIVTVVLSSLAPSAPAHAVEIVQYFPVPPPGAPATPPETGWRIRYAILPQLTHGYGGAAVWEIQSVEFMRGYTQTGAQDWVRILNNLALAEMYVPYYDGYEIWDVQGFSGFVEASPTFIRGAGVISASLQPDSAVIAEVVDDHVRWMSVFNQARRGQRLDLWATLAAANYRYIMRYSFLDDGTIQVRVAGTAQNFRSVPVGDEAGMHVHLAAWRMEFDLGAPDANDLHVEERIGDPASAAADLVHRPFNNGVEGGEVWIPEKFTSLVVESTAVDDRHSPPLKIGYKLMPLRGGALRNYHRYTQNDVWAALLTGPTGSTDRLRFIDVPSYVELARPLAGHSFALWATAALHHVPRTEDFGAVGNRAADGLALAMWTGFDLMPHNLWDKTPLFPLP
jgi:Copper amine oxidase, enzyme domain